MMISSIATSTASTTSTTSATSTPTTNAAHQLYTSIDASRLKRLLEIEKRYIDIIAQGVQQKIEGELREKGDSKKMALRYP